jgi:hypothetical protein
MGSYFDALIKLKGAMGFGSFAFAFALVVMYQPKANVPNMRSRFIEN